MALESIIQRAFGGGELAPALHARADQVKYTTGGRTVRNFIVRKAGGVSNRPGTRFIAECKTNSSATKLIRYKSEVAGESALIEAGSGYMRFFVDGAPVEVDPPPAAWGGGTQYFIGDIVESGGVNYYAKANSLGQAPPNATFWYPMPGDLLEIYSPFGTAGFQWSQSGRIITLTEDDTPPHELEFVSLQHWIMRPISTAPSVLAPANVAVTPGAAGTRRIAYVVTAALAETYEESEASGQAIDFAAAEATLDAPHVITWDAVVGAAEYYVYSDPYNSGTYGFIGTATGTLSFNDAGFEPDYGVTPPVARVLFNSINNYPAVSATYKQRRFFGNTKAAPDAIFGSRVGFRSNFGISSPLQDDDAISFKIAGEHAHPIRHMVGLKPLVVLTDGGGWSVRGGEGGLTPSSINPDQETYAGAYERVRPVVVGNSILYVQARGAIVRDLQFDIDVEGLAGRDLTIYASHLFKGHTIRCMDYAETPDSIVWATRSDGRLLGLTYLREHEVWGWHRHDTESGVARFGEVCVVPENEIDAVYLTVTRTVDGNQVLYIEKLENRDIETFDEDAFFVDSGLSYSGAPTNTIGGLQHLEGKRVAIVGDGTVISDGVTGTAYTVNGSGDVTPNLPANFSEIHAGLPYNCDLETLDLDVQGTDIRGKKKRVAAVSILLDESSRVFKAGPDTSHLRDYSRPAHEAAADEFTGLVEISLTSAFNNYGRVLIRQSQPLPITILGVIPHVEGGG